MKPTLFKFILLTLCTAPMFSHAQGATASSPKIQIIQSTDKTIAQTVYFDSEGKHSPLIKRLPERYLTLSGSL